MSPARNVLAAIASAFVACKPMIPLRRLAALAAPLLVIACNDGQITSPAVEVVDAPQFSHVSGGRLYGTNTGGGVPRGSGPSTLYTIDATTGIATAVGATGFSGVGGLAFAADGTLYGISSVGNLSLFQLITIDVDTGAGTLVGSVGGSFRNFMDISFRNGDGVLFASLLPPKGTGCTRLATIDVTTGAATDIGDIGTCFPGRGLAFSTTDVLYHSDQNRSEGLGTLYTVNQTTAARTPVATLSFVGFPPNCCLRLNALDYEPDTGVQYASVSGGFGGSGPNFLATVNPTTGVVTNVGQSVNGLDAIAWQPILNQPPDADASATSTTVECTASASASVTLDASGSSDTDGDALTYTWKEGATVLGTTSDPTDQLTVSLSLGTHTITLSVDDGNGGTDTDDVVIDVVDTTSPTINLSVNPTELWPANHRYRTIDLAALVSDACDDNPSVEVWVESSELDNATGNGDGNTTGDIRVTLSGATVLLSSDPDVSVHFNLSDLDELELRAEQAGTGPGRTYTITVMATDASGNESEESVTVTVPHDQR